MKEFAWPTVGQLFLAGSAIFLLSFTNARGLECLSVLTEEGTKYYPPSSCESKKCNEKGECELAEKKPEAAVPPDEAKPPEAGDANSMSTLQEAIKRVEELTKQRQAELEEWQKFLKANPGSGAPALPPWAPDPYSLLETERLNALQAIDNAINEFNPDEPLDLNNAKPPPAPEKPPKLESDPWYQIYKEWLKENSKPGNPTSNVKPPTLYAAAPSPYTGFFSPTPSSAGGSTLQAIGAYVSNAVQSYITNLSAGVSGWITSWFTHLPT